MSTPTPSKRHTPYERSRQASTIPISNMTPIHIRGKKRAHLQSDFTQTAAVEGRTSKRLRPASIKSKSRFAKERHAPRHSNSTTSAELHPISPLEALPTELLQQIFLSTCNTALPRSSPFLAAKLSAPHIYKEVLARVFCQAKYRSKDVWRVNFALDENDEYLSHARGDVLKCRWMTWALFSDYRSRVVEQERQRLALAFSTGSSRQPRYFHTSGVDLWSGPECHIPSKLLRWPCEAVNFEFLRVLAKLGATVDAVNSFDPERLADMFRGAAGDRDYRLMHLLMLRGLLGPPQKQHFKMALEASGRDVIMVMLVLKRLMRAPLPDKDEVLGIPPGYGPGIVTDVLDLQAPNPESGEDPAAYLRNPQHMYTDALISSHPEDDEWIFVVRNDMQFATYDDDYPDDDDDDYDDDHDDEEDEGDDGEDDDDEDDDDDYEEDDGEDDDEDDSD